MNFDDLLKAVTNDDRSVGIPIVYIVQILVIVADALKKDSL